MATLKTDNIKHAMMSLEAVSRSTHSFFALYDNIVWLDNAFGDLFPFQNICNALLGDAAIKWCQVFGTKSESNHWKNLVDDEEAFKVQLLAYLEITQEQFMSYWKEMTEFRNGAIAHATPVFFQSDKSVPSLRIALESTCFTHRYLRKLLNEKDQHSHPDDLKHYGVCSAEALLFKLNAPRDYRSDMVC